MKWETETDAKARCLTGLQFWVWANGQAGGPVLGRARKENEKKAG
jgi:hypothetical protein